MQSLNQTLYPQNELASPPIIQPLRKPSLVSTIADKEGGPEVPTHSSSTSSGCSAQTKQRRPESYDLTGSVFLITGSGKTLSLPVPSGSPLDPLNWTQWKRNGAILAIACFCIFSLTLVQAAALLYHDIMREFKGGVRMLGHHFSTKSHHVAARDQKVQ